MKKLIISGLLTGLMFGFGPQLAEAGEQSEPAGPAPAASMPAPPVFSLENLPQDSPALTKKKAALRLFKAYGVTLGQLATCRGQAAPEAEKALAGFTSRNGNTLATVMGVIKQLGGLSPEVKSIVDAAVAEEAAKPGDCRALVQAVADGQRDIYKAPQFLDDYKLIRSK